MTRVNNLEDVREIWKVTFELAGRKEVVFMLADDVTAALAKALHYQKQYTIIDEYRLSHLELVSETFI